MSNTSLKLPSLGPEPRAPRILIVDDEPLILRACARAVAARGYTRRHRAERPGRARGDAARATST